MSRILVIWPSLLEGATIRELVTETAEHVGARFPEAQLEFIVADDSQGADTELNALAAEDSRLRIWTPNSRLGHQRGLIAVLRYRDSALSLYVVVVTMDADGEDRPSDIPRLIEPVLTGQSDLVRAKRGSRSVGNSFRLGYLFYRGLFRTLTGLRITSGNFAAARGSWWQGEVDSSIWNLSFSGALASVVGRTQDVDCARDARRVGRSRMNFGSLLGYGLMFALPFSLRIAVRAAVLAGAAAVVAALLIITVTVIRLFTTQATPGWATTVVFGAVAVVLMALVALTSSLVLYSATQSGRKDSGRFRSRW